MSIHSLGLFGSFAADFGTIDPKFLFFRALWNLQISFEKKCSSSKFWCPPYLKVVQIASPNIKLCPLSCAFFFPFPFNFHQSTCLWHMPQMQTIPFHICAHSSSLSLSTCFSSFLLSFIKMHAFEAMSTSVCKCQMRHVKMKEMLMWTCS